MLAVHGSGDESVPAGRQLRQPSRGRQEEGASRATPDAMTAETRRSDRNRQGHVVVGPLELERRQCSAQPPIRGHNPQRDRVLAEVTSHAGELSGRSAVVSSISDPWR